MRFRWTPSSVATIVLLVVILAAVLRIPFMQPEGVVTGEYRVEGNVVALARGESSAQVTLDALLVHDATKPHRVLVTVPRDLLPDIGDRVAVVCTLETPEPFNGFAYDKYLAIRDIYAICRTHDALWVLAHDADRSVATLFTKLRMAIVRAISDALPLPQSTLLAGLLVGDAQFRDAWRERFLATGTSHIVAASGFNVSVVCLVAFTFLTFLGMRRPRAFWLLAVAIVGYVVLAGMEPAVVRAGVMGGLVLLAKKLGRKTTMRNVVLLAVAVMLTVEPRLFLYDVGFQLSVISTVALIWIAPAFAKRMTWVPETLGVREIFASTLAATLCTLPLVVLQFGTVSLIGPLVNLLVLPLVPYAMAFGAAGMLVASVSVDVARVALLPAWGLLSVMLEIIRVTASVPLLFAVPTVVRVTLAVLLTLFIPVVLWRKGLYGTSSSRAL